MRKNKNENNNAIQIMKNNYTSKTTINFFTMFCYA